jgi:hopanoid biosynthesis associated radical SAM protein HpnH
MNDRSLLIPMVPISQIGTVASYILKQKIRGRKRYPLLLMLEPLFRCNLACAGCGKIQYPEPILSRRLTPEQCWRAAEECGCPIIAIPGGEPLIHPEIDVIVRGLVERKKYVYLCTNALLLKRKLNLFKASKYLTFSVHLDGLRSHHDQAVCRDGTFDIAVDAIKVALAQGFRVTTNSTIFDGVDPGAVREFFDFAMDLGVEGMMISPGYQYENAPDQKHFLKKQKSIQLFKKILGNPRRRWRFNLSPLFLRFLQGEIDYDCTPWGMPTYNVLGWQRPCYLLQDGSASTFAELMEATRWEQYGPRSGNKKCSNCMVHSGYEASAVDDTFGSLGGLLRTAKAVLLPNTRTARGEVSKDASH